MLLEFISQIRVMDCSFTGREFSDESHMNALHDHSQRLADLAFLSFSKTDGVSLLLTDK